MVVHVETQDRVRDLLKEALPMLCRSGLTGASEFSVEALIGITLNKNDVFLVSIKETVKSDLEDSEMGETSLEVNVTKTGAHESPHQRKHHRKRRRSKQSPSKETYSEFDHSCDEYEDPAVKMEANKSDLDYENNDNSGTSTSMVFHELNESLNIKEEDESDLNLEESNYSAEMNTSQSYGLSVFPQATLGSPPVPFATGQEQAYPIAGSSYEEQIMNQIAGHSSTPQQAAMASYVATTTYNRSRLGNKGDAIAYMLQVPGAGWKCTACAHFSKWKHCMREHVLVQHLQMKRACICGQEFKWWRNLIDHKKVCATALAERTSK